jgi:hypothetical protein
MNQSENQPLIFAVHELKSNQFLGQVELLKNRQFKLIELAQVSAEHILSEALKNVNSKNQFGINCKFDEKLQKSVCEFEFRRDDAKFATHILSYFEKQLQLILLPK